MSLFSSPLAKEFFDSSLYLYLAEKHKFWHSIRLHFTEIPIQSSFTHNILIWLTCHWSPFLWMQTEECGGFLRDRVTWRLQASMNVKYDRAVSDFTHWDLTAASLWPRSSLSCHQDTGWHIFFLPLAVAACALLNMLPLSLSSTALTLYRPYATWKLHAM